ncbi:hypothetical protein HHX48_09515 [Salinimonas sp. HHU 13199]|uniref:Uncharacterized protein n=1 Tax=Salinimonas profundi TaxID=2729140 RepID=A0ABR8LKY3_9ALTE|nr:hypothetical protein [Salinimonas profundi]MBD3585973.1 hypothetical protein [Salinimonas profundi]
MKRLLAHLNNLSERPALLNQEVTTVLSLFCEKFERRVQEIDTISDEGYVKVTFSDETIGYGYIDVDENVLIEIEDAFRLTVFTFSQHNNAWQFIERNSYDIAGTMTPKAAQLAPRMAQSSSPV